MVFLVVRDGEDCWMFQQLRSGSLTKQKEESQGLAALFDDLANAGMS